MQTILLMPLPVSHGKLFDGKYFATLGGLEGLEPRQACMAPTILPHNWLLYLGTSIYSCAMVIVTRCKKVPLATRSQESRSQKVPMRALETPSLGLNHMKIS